MIADPAPPDPRELYAASYQRLVRILTLAADCRADAEDVVQEAFVRLASRWAKVSRYDDPEAWVRQVAFRLLSNRRRHARAKARALLSRRPPEPTPQPSSDDIDVRRALAALPLAQRQVVVLHHLLELPVAEVAAELKIPVGTVKSRLSRARAALAPLLREEVGHD